jgi:hypothetical protein
MVAAASAAGTASHLNAPSSGKRAEFIGLWFIRTGVPAGRPPKRAARNGNFRTGDGRPKWLDLSAETGSVKIADEK